MMIPRAKNDRPPSVWQQRRLRIAQQNADRLRRKQERLDARAAPVEDDEDGDEERAPARRPRPRPGNQRPSPRGGGASRGGKASAIVSRERLKKQRGGIERTSAWIVLLISFTGSVAAFHGGFGPLIESVQTKQYNTAALLGGVMVQLLLTVLEWWYFDNWKIAWSARLVDAATTALGYGPLLLAPLLVFLYNQGVKEPLPLAWGILGVLSLLVAWYPENRLVD